MSTLSTSLPEGVINPWEGRSASVAAHRLESRKGNLVMASCARWQSRLVRPDDYVEAVHHAR